MVHMRILIESVSNYINTVLIIIIWCKGRQTLVFGRRGKPVFLRQREGVWGEGILRLILITSHLFLSTSGRRLKELNYSWLIAVEPHALGKNFRRNTLHLHTLEGKDLIYQQGNKSNEERVQGCNKVIIDSELMNGGKKRRNKLNLAGFATETALFLSHSHFSRPFAWILHHELGEQSNSIEGLQRLN